MQMDASTISLGIVWYAAFLFSLTVHEAAHALAALKLGDPTGYQGGQVTLNPLPHIRRAPFGTIVVPLLSYAFAGWMMGWASAPYDPVWAERHPKRAAWMALAGPASNFCLMLLAGLGIRVGMMVGVLEAPAPGMQIDFTSIVAGSAGFGEGLATFLSVLFTLNLLLFLFNLIPFPPLDGSAALQLFLPRETALRWQTFLRQPMMNLVGLYIAWSLIGRIFVPTFLFALSLLYPEYSFG